MKRWMMIGLLILGCGDDEGDPGTGVVVDSGALVTEAGPNSFDAATQGDSGLSASEAGIPDSGTPIEASATTLAEASVTTEETLDGATSESLVKDASGPLTDDAAPDAGDVPDAAPVCNIPPILGSECSLEDNCGCAENKVCRVASAQTRQTLCFDPGETPDYSICSAHVDCAANSICELGICRPKCLNTGTFCEDGSWCGPMTEGGASVCQGHCNPMPLTPTPYGTDTFWIELMPSQIERGLIAQAWTQAFIPCGESTYCHPGMKDSLTPYSHCVPGLYELGLGLPCAVHRDCATGLGCYEDYCTYIAFTDTDCGEYEDLSEADDDYKYFSVEGWSAPDGFNKFGVCVEQN